MEGTRIELGEWAGQLENILLDQREEQGVGRTMVPVPSRKKIMYGLELNNSGRSEEEEEEFKQVYMPKKVGLGPRLTDYILPNPKEASLAVVLRRNKQHSEESLLNVLERYYKGVDSVAEELKSAYDTLDQRWHQDHHASFVQMMLLDGLFLLEVIVTVLYPDRHDNHVIKHMLEKDEDKKRCLHDILLLQNQLPINLLLTLLRIQDGCTDLNLQYIDQSIEFEMRLFEQYITILLGIQTRHDGSVLARDELENKLNILDLYQSCRMYKVINYKETRWGGLIISKILKPINHGGRLTRYNISEYIPPATKLHEAGITFDVIIPSDFDTDRYISFSNNTLMLPEIEVDSYTKSLFLNLIAFENLHSRHIADNNYYYNVTSYMYLMGCLIHGAEDVTLLQSHGIIISNLPRAQLAAIFNRISENISLHPDYLNPDFKDMVLMVRERYNKLTKEWRKDLFQTYLKSPWAVISLFGAFFIFILTLVQTVYALLSYNNRK